MSAAVMHKNCRKGLKGPENGETGQIYRVFAAGYGTCYEKY